MRVPEWEFQIRDRVCTPDSGGQRDREANPARGGSQTGTCTNGSSGTTPALRATPPDSGGELSHALHFKGSESENPQDRGTVDG